MVLKKRFIAGAKCMKCQAMDRVMIFISENDEWIECVDCGYTEKRPTSVTEVTNSPSKHDEFGVVRFKPIR